jgi:hypothetical protein
MIILLIIPETTRISIWYPAKSVEDNFHVLPANPEKQDIGEAALFH